MSEPTPGPWNAHLFGVYRVGASTAVAMVLTHGDAGRADARLVAAAPDMLAALRTALAALEHAGGPVVAAKSDLWPSVRYRAIEAARAAIAKADGGA